MSDVNESRLDEMASKIAILEEEVADLKKKVRVARRQSRKATGAGGKGGKGGGGGGGGGGKRKKEKEAASED